VSAEPSRTLAPSARWVWRAEQALAWGVVVVVAAVASFQLDGALAVLALVLPAAALVAGVAVVPLLRWRNWRWEVHPQAVDIRHGTLTVRRTLIPVVRVQHVETSRDVLERSLGLATVKIHTAAGSHRIPLLRAADAGEVRDRIADLAPAADEP
jgi:membrane protein YdbS with pleckstrin-like domain